MDLEKTTIINIVLFIHLALTGLALMRLFRLKNATGGLVITSLIVLMIPILGPSGLIIYLDKKYKKQQKNQKNNTQHVNISKNKNKK